MEKAKIFSKGNEKIGSNCAVLSLPNKITCKLGLKCRAYCYSSYSQNPTVTEAARLRTLEWTKKDTFVKDAIAELKRMRILDSVRLMSHGDAYSLEYAYKLYEIAKAFPHIMFYQYTKRDDIYTKEVIARKPANYNLIYSYDGVDPDYSNVQSILSLGYNRVAIVYDKLPVTPSCVQGGKEYGSCMSVCKKCLQSSAEPIFLKVHGAGKNKR